MTKMLQEDRGATIDAQFKALSDGTRRALLEYLVREGEQSVHALTAVSSVSQPMVSRHLGKLKRAKLVTARRARQGAGPGGAMDGGLWRALVPALHRAGGRGGVTAWG